MPQVRTGRARSHSRPPSVSGSVQFTASIAAGGGRAEPSRVEPRRAELTGPGRTKIEAGLGQAESG